MVICLNVPQRTMGAAIACLQGFAASACPAIKIPSSHTDIHTALVLLLGHVRPEPTALSKSSPEVSAGRIDRALKESNK